MFGLTWAHFLNDGAANYLPGVLPAVLVSLHEPVRMAGVLVASLWIGQATQPLVALSLSASTTILIGQDMFPENRSTGSGIALGLANGIGALLVLVLGFWVNTKDMAPLFGVLAAAALFTALLAFTFAQELMGDEPNRS